MKKLVLLSVIALSTSPCFAKISSSVTATSNFVWRGLSVSGDSSVIQGGMSYTHGSGVTAGLFLSGQNAFGTANTMSNPYVSYTMTHGDYAITGQAYYFNFNPDASENNALDLSVNVARAGFKVSANYMPNYFGKSDTSDLYLNAGYSHNIEQGVNVMVGVGYSMFADDKKTGKLAFGNTTNYMDMKAAVQHVSNDGTTIEMGVTDADYKTYNAAGTTKTEVAHKSRTYVSLTKAF